MMSISSLLRFYGSSENIDFKQSCPAQDHYSNIKSHGIFKNSSIKNTEHWVGVKSQQYSNLNAVTYLNFQAENCLGNTTRFHVLQYLMIRKMLDVRM